MTLSMNSVFIGVSVTNMYWVGAVLGGSISGDMSSAVLMSCGLGIVVMVGWMCFDTVFHTDESPGERTLKS